MLKTVTIDKILENISAIDPNLKAISDKIKLIDSDYQDKLTIDTIELDNTEDMLLEELSLYLLASAKFKNPTSEIVEYNKLAKSNVNWIDIVFEAAPKDIIFPRKYFLNEDETDIHIEMLINWASRTSTGSPIGGFIPYLKVYAEIQNSKGELLNNSENVDPNSPMEPVKSRFNLVTIHRYL